VWQFMAVIQQAAPLFGLPTTTPNGHGTYGDGSGQYGCWRNSPLIIICLFVYNIDKPGNT